MRTRSAREGIDDVAAATEPRQALEAPTPARPQTTPASAPHAHAAFCVSHASWSTVNARPAFSCASSHAWNRWSTSSGYGSLSECGSDYLGGCRALDEVLQHLATV
jgi:hypothetical protein